MNLNIFRIANRYCVCFALFFFYVLMSFSLTASAEAQNNSVLGPFKSLLAYSALPQQEECGDKVLSIKSYEQVSHYALVAGFALIFVATLLKSPKSRIGLGVIAVFPFIVWGYIYFLLDYEEMNRQIFNYNIQAESTLNNIAEGQDRYKSEQGVYLDDLKKLHSHVAGATGYNKCVKILELKVYYDYWTAAAQHISSPEKVFWDSRTGSSLKKG